MVNNKIPTPYAIRPFLAGLLALPVACGCGSGAMNTPDQNLTPDSGLTLPPTDCTSHSNPTLQIGLSDQSGRFLSELVDGQGIKMTMGSQGGCHLWLAFRSDGLLGKGMHVNYTIIDHDDNDRVVVDMLALENFTMEPLYPSQCEAGAFKAFVLQARRRENHHLRLTVKLTDSAYSAATKSVDNIQALWPDPIPGLNRTDYCGTM